MKTLIVPVDFSNTSLNAAIYAGELAESRNFDQVLLIGNFHISLLEQVMPSPDMVQEDAESIGVKRKLVEDHLSGLVEKLRKNNNSGHTVISSVIAKDQLKESIAEVIATVKPQLMVIGSKAPESDEDNFVADQLIALIAAISIPVMVVPDRYEYFPISSAIVAGNFRSQKNAGLLTRLKIISGAHTLKLSLLHVNDDQTFEAVAGITNDCLIDSLSGSLPGYEYQVSTVAKHDLVHGLSDFASRSRTEIIIALPEHHSLFYELFHTSALHKIYTFTYIPILILK